MDDVEVGRMGADGGGSVAPLAGGTRQWWRQRRTPRQDEEELSSQSLTCVERDVARLRLAELHEGVSLGLEHSPRARTEMPHSLIREGLQALSAKYCDADNKSNAQVCSICTEEITSSGKTVFQSPRCTHVFHTSCLGWWVASSSNLRCPNCRESFRPPEVRGTPADKLRWAMDPGQPLSAS